MTITYPRPFPDAEVRATRVRFDYTTLGEMSRTAAGAITFQERVGGSLWELGLTTKPLNETEYSKWHTWYLSLRGGAQSFMAHDPRRCWPIRYGPNLPPLRWNGTPFDGTCTIQAVTGAEIQLANLPDSYFIEPGDYVSFPWLGGRALVKALEISSSGSGGVSLPFAVGPWLRTGGTLPVTGTLVKAWCLMRMKPGTWNGERMNVDPVSFEAIQTLV